MRPAAAATVLLSFLLLVGCGGSSGEQGSNEDPGPGATLEELLRTNDEMRYVWAGEGARR